MDKEEDISEKERESLKVALWLWRNTLAHRFDWETMDLWNAEARPQKYLLIWAAVDASQ